MKRCRLGLWLLIVLLGLSLWSGVYTTSVHTPLCADIRQSGLSVLAGDWDRAEELLARVRQSWDARHDALAALADHEPMESISALLAQLEAAARLRDNAAFASLCAHLEQSLAALKESHTLSWWNIF